KLPSLGASGYGGGLRGHSGGFRVVSAAAEGKPECPPPCPKPSADWLCNLPPNPSFSGSSPNTQHPPSPPQTKVHAPKPAPPSRGSPTAPPSAPPPAPRSATPARSAWDSA